MKFAFFEGNVLFLNNLFHCILLFQNYSKNKIDMQTSLHVDILILAAG